MQVSANIKNFFFDREEVIKAVGKAEAKILSKAGGKIQISAKSLLVFKPLVRKPRKSRNVQANIARMAEYRAKKKASASPPGAVPFVRRRQYPNLSSIQYGYEQSSRKMVIGPIVRRKRSSDRTAPDMHEHGGATIINVSGKDGKIIPVKANYPKRPLMGPAFEKVKSELPRSFNAAIGPA